MSVRGGVLAVMLLVAASAGADERSDLARARSLAWSKHFDEAAAIYASVLRDHPGSRDGVVGLAQVRLWQGRYAEARRLFQEFPRDPEAVEGAATAAYWSGDFRTAEREYRALLVKHPDRTLAQRSLDELRAASATRESFDAGVVDDDQPYRAARVEARVSMFSDPLTRWDAIAGAYHLSSDVTHGSAPFLVAENETVFPALRMTTTISFGGIKTPDDHEHAIGGAAARFKVAAHDTIGAGILRREIMTNATLQFPFVDVTSLRWNHESSWLASAGAEHDRFSDHNSAKAFDAYGLFRVRRTGKATFWAGASALMRDTAESRFDVTQINATPDPSGGFFHFTYLGGYDPYWTPLDLREARLIVAVERRIGSGTTMRLQADGGIAHDRGITFWPESAPTPVPAVGTSTYPRTYSPWRVRLSASTPIAAGVSLDLAYEHGTTADYRANTFHATLARRR